MSDRLLTRNRRRNFVRWFHTLFQPNFDVDFWSNLRRSTFQRLVVLHCYSYMDSFCSRMHIRCKMKLRALSVSNRLISDTMNRFLFVVRSTRVRRHLACISTRKRPHMSANLILTLFPTCTPKCDRISTSIINEPVSYTHLTLPTIYSV